MTSATLNGTVDPNSRATTWYFEYGTSTSYGSKTADRNAGSGTSTTSVSAPVSGLTRGRLYHYRLVATSDAGTSRGADQTFSTTTAPTVVTAAASSIGPTSARLNGTVTANGQADELVLRVRHDHELRLQDRCQERRLGHERGQRLVVADRPADEHHLPLPPGRDERLRAPPSAATGASAPRSRRSSRRALPGTSVRRRRRSPARPTREDARRPGTSSTGLPRATGRRRRRRSAGSGSAARNVTASLSGLTPGAPTTTGSSRRATPARAAAPTPRSRRSA